MACSFAMNCRSGMTIAIVAACVVIPPALVTESAARTPVTKQLDKESQGYLFVDGQYVAPPFEFRTDERGVLINDVFIDFTSLGLTEQDFFKWEMVPETSPPDDGRDLEVRFRRKPVQPQYPLRNVEPYLETRNVVVVNSGSAPTVLTEGVAGYEFLKLIATADRRMNVAVADLEKFGNIDRPQWCQWIQTFQPSDDLMRRVEEEIQRVEVLRAENLRVIKANDRLNASSYPLTVVGMILVVCAFGHLINHKPPASGNLQVAALPLEENRAIIRGLVLVIALSVLDLVWTMLAHRAGAMSELNPLGSRFIDDARSLILFKLVATAIAAGILFATRRYHFARRACWWSLLICTLLAARWISINSAFV